MENTRSRRCVISGVAGMTRDMNLFKKIKNKIKNVLFDRLFTDLRFGGSWQRGNKHSLGHFKAQIIATTELCSVKLPSGVL